MNAKPLSFFDHTPESFQAATSDWQLPGYLTGQLFDWVYQKGITSPAAMTNLSKQHRAILGERVAFQTGSVLQTQLATDGTRKLLIQWNASTDPESKSLNVLADDPTRQTETVMIPSDRRRTACVSSQVGCPVGCRFCASGLGGLDGNLTRGRIVEQVQQLNALPDAERVTNVVFMGMGEPLANYGAVTDAIRTINAPWGLGIGARRITVSTVGLPAAIRKLVGFEIPVTLALSLHAPNDQIRRDLIPWAQYTTVDELLDACQEYFDATGREITFEYILLANVNDQPEHARELAELTKTVRANVNLIRYNEVAGLPFGRPADDDVHRFQAILRKHRVNVHIRASRGRDIAAACGQLRHEHSSAADCQS